MFSTLQIAQCYGVISASEITYFSTNLGKSKKNTENLEAGHECHGSGAELRLSYPSKSY